MENGNWNEQTTVMFENQKNFHDELSHPHWGDDRQYLIQCG